MYQIVSCYLNWRHTNLPGTGITISLLKLIRDIKICNNTDFKNIQISENAHPFLLSPEVEPQTASITFTSGDSFYPRSILQSVMKGYQLKEFIFEVLKWKIASIILRTLHNSCISSMWQWKWFEKTILSWCHQWERVGREVAFYQHRTTAKRVLHIKWIFLW